jgi:hypothetical protein
MYIMNMVNIEGSRLRITIMQDFNPTSPYNATNSTQYNVAYCEEHKKAFVVGCRVIAIAPSLKKTTDGKPHYEQNDTGQVIRICEKGIEVRWDKDASERYTNRRKIRVTAVAQGQHTERPIDASAVAQEEHTERPIDASAVAQEEHTERPIDASPGEGDSPAPRPWTTIPDPRGPEGAEVGIVAFYFPGKKEPCDTACQAGGSHCGSHCALVVLSGPAAVVRRALTTPCLSLLPGRLPGQLLRRFPCTNHRQSDYTIGRRGSILVQ